MLWTRIPSPNGAWFSPAARVVLPRNRVPAMAKGGFLCEEMGLGKTVEVLALVLGSPAPAGWIANGDPKNSTCSSPSEHVDGLLGLYPAMELRPAQRYRSAATLVVCAVSLVGQWIEEARSKLSGGAGLRIHMYHGTKRIKDAKKLAQDFDLIVTTYQTLASDRGKDQRDHPMSQIEWYRIVLDEAHMAKSAGTAHSKVCHELRAARRWACTGTPMGTDIADLHGQLRFLGAYPANVKSVFDNWFKDPLGRTSKSGCRRSAAMALHFCGGFTIRHTKNQTLGGRKILELPAKHESTVDVALEPAERAKYDELSAAAKRTFQEKYAARGDNFISSKILSIMSLLMPLRRLCSGGNLTRMDL